MILLLLLLLVLHVIKLYQKVKVIMFSKILYSFWFRNIMCYQANLPYTTLYSNSVGTTVEDVRIRSGSYISYPTWYLDEVIYVMGLEAFYTGITGIYLLLFWIWYRLYNTDYPDYYSYYSCYHFNYYYSYLLLL